MKLRRSLLPLALPVLVLLLAGCTVGGDGRLPVTADGQIPAEPPKITPPGQAVLVRGSESVRGIAGFGRNAIPALFGEYALGAADGETQLLSVWFTREALVLDEAWSSLSCPGLPAGFALAQSSPAGDGSLMVTASAAEYRIVIRLPEGFGSPCRFAAVFVDRLAFFMRNAAREEDISFPAFLQL